MENLELIAPTLMLLLNLLRMPGLPPVNPDVVAAEAPDTIAEQSLPPEELPQEPAEAPAEIVEAPEEPIEPVEAVELAEVVEAPAEPVTVAPVTAKQKVTKVKKPKKEWPAVVVFTEGLTGTYVTRIILQETRSNFVFEDYMPGLYFNVKTTPFKPVNFMARLSAYYPSLSFFVPDPGFSFFNKFPQPPKDFLHYAADLAVGPVFEPNIMDRIRFNLSPGLHVFFQNSDRWNYLHLGAAAQVGIELPISTRWTIYLDGLASLDYGNLGNNRTIEPLDIVYQYQVGLGVRYSKKTPNARPYIKPWSPRRPRRP